MKLIENHEKTCRFVSYALVAKDERMRAEIRTLANCFIIVPRFSICVTTVYNNSRRWKYADGNSNMKPIINIHSGVYIGGNNIGFKNDTNKYYRVIKNKFDIRQ